ncbi:MAG: hypothetical protein NTV46_19130 [Verrucomicrobia bacterium]|nr:hypothetical protein [Verrucomicrobiota bacterium]
MTTTPGTLISNIRTERGRPGCVGRRSSRWPGGEHDDFLQCVKTRKDPYFPVDIGHRVSTVCHLASISIKTGCDLRWDPVAEKFPDDEEANNMFDRPRRDPWQLPNL